MADRCPKCGKDVPAGAGSAPFCSDRCRMIDLGGWLSGAYRIPGPPQPDRLGSGGGPGAPPLETVFPEAPAPSQGGEDDDPKVKH